MALIILGRSKCSICDNVLNSIDDIISTTAFILDQNDSLWRFSDSAMHKSCFVAWEHRKDFIDKYNKTAGITRGHHMEEDGSISIVE